jgi:hypothetical protein
MRSETRRSQRGTNLDVRQRELDLSIDSSRSNERRVERLDLVGGHDDFDVASSVEPVELVEEFEHGSLDLSLAAGGRVVSER